MSRHHRSITFDYAPVTHTLLTNFSIQQSRNFEGVCIPLLLMNCLFPVPDSQPAATELFQSPLYGSGTVFCSISHLLRHFLSSAVAWRHTSLNSVTRNYCCRACEVTLSFMDTLIALTYLLVSTDPRVECYWPCLTGQSVCFFCCRRNMMLLISVVFFMVAVPS